MEPSKWCAKDTMALARGMFISDVQQKLPRALSFSNLLRFTPNKAEALKELYRFAHTLKGSGYMVGLRDIADPAYEITTAITLIRNYGIKIEKGLIDFIDEKLQNIMDETTQFCQRVPLVMGTLPFGDQRKVLIVDDDRSIAELVKDRLEKEGISTAVCYNAEEAKTYLMCTLPDLILLDIVMPGENGVDFCRRLRSDEKMNFIPIIFFSVRGDLQDKLTGFANGADDYLPKPFAMDELIARIHASLNRVELYDSLAWKDELTRTYNRRYLERRLKEELHRAQSLGDALTIAMIDVDRFKEINDLRGHAAGDEVLRLLAARISETLRSSDVVCRYGGDEFVVIFPASEGFRAQGILDRVRKRMYSTPVVKANCQGIKLTLSIGVASYPDNGETVDQLLQAADEAMYQSKQSGGNSVVLAKGVDIGREHKVLVDEDSHHLCKC